VQKQIGDTSINLMSPNPAKSLSRC